MQNFIVILHSEFYRLKITEQDSARTGYTNNL